MSNQTVRAKVAELIDDYQLALNAGSNQGVAMGNEVLLYRVVDIRDPDTNEELGSVRLRKVRLTVNHVQAKLCIAKVSDRAGTESLSSQLGWSNSRPLVKVVEEPVFGEVDKGEVGVTVGEQADIVVSTKPEEPPF